MDKEARLLQTKFFTPRASGNLIHRSRLTQIIEAGIDGKILLISAPAGFGKTSLMLDWIQEYHHQPAWLNLDANDNDPNRFVEYLIGAYSYLRTPILQKLLDDNQYLFKGNTQSQIEVLLNCIFDSGEKITLVLDDFQNIHSSTIINLMNYFIENLPENTAVILLTRSDPPLNLANWRARSYLTEVRQADLCFTEEEARTFITRNIPFQLSQENIDNLIHKVEGWPAGMQLATTAILRQNDKAGAERFIESFKGTNRFILEYLVEEVLNNQSEEIRKFLLYTSQLDSFCAPLCDYILEKNNSRELLDYLERNNLFIIPLDNQQKWYRYHRLFSDLLKSQVEPKNLKRVNRIHKMAAEWYEQNGQYGEAIEHYFLAKDDSNAARLIQSQAKHVLNQSEFFTFSNWVKRLPKKYLNSNPTLCAYYAIALLVEAHPVNEIFEILEIMDQMKSENKFDQTIVRVLLSMIQGNYDETAQYIQSIHDNPPNEDEFLMGLLDMAQAIIFEEDVDTTLARLLDTSKKAKANGNLTIAITSLCFAGDLVRSQGKLHGSWKIYQDALALARVNDEEYLPAGSIALLDLGEVSYKWNKLDDAEKYLKKSLELSDNWEITHFFSGLTSLARVEIALGRYEEANALMQKATDLAQQFDATDVDDFVVACRIIQLRLLMGDDTQMDDLENRLPNPTPPSNWKNDSFLLTIALTQEIQELTQAWVLLHKDKYSQAIPMLTDLLDRALSKHLEDYAIQFAVLLAIAYHKNWNKEKALEYIGIAMRMAKKEDQVQVFLEQGVEILDLLYDAADRGIEADFAGRILALSPQMEIIDRNDNLIHYKEEIIEPLSRREMDILKEISKGLSNQEIAYALNLSLSTVKVHTYNIFRKLNVRNRTQAVTKARLINILP